MANTTAVDTNNSLLLDHQPDPFAEDSGLSGNKRLYVVHPQLLLSGLAETIGHGIQQMEAAARLFTVNIDHVIRNAATISQKEGTHIPKIFQYDQPTLSLAQREFYLTHPDLPQQPAHFVKITKNGPPVPVATSMSHLPTSVIAPVQKCLGSGWPASNPGTCLPQLAVRLLLPYANPANLARHIAPPLNKMPTMDNQSLERVQSAQNAAIQKMNYRNLLAESLGFKQMSLDVFRRWTINHGLGPFNNHTHIMCFDGKSDASRLILRRVLKLAYPLALGKEAHLGIHIATIQLRTFTNLTQLHKLGTQLDQVTSENGANCWNGAVYSNDMQARFAKDILPPDQYVQWKRGEYPPKGQYEIKRDANGRKSLNTVINWYKCDKERFQYMRYDQLEEDALDRKSYVAAITIYVHGMAPIILQVGHLESWELSGELMFILTSCEVKKIVIGRKTAALAMKHSFDLPWDSNNGVIDVQEININRSLKPYNGGKLEIADFARITGYAYWGTGTNTLEERKGIISIEERFGRLSIANPMAVMKIELDQETKDYLGLYAQVPLNTWHWLVANNPDALLHVTGAITERIAIRNLDSANLARVWVFQDEMPFCKRYNPIHDIDDKEIQGDTGTLFDLYTEQKDILLAAQDRPEYEKLFLRYLQSDDVGLKAAAKDFYKAFQILRLKPSYFGEHTHYKETDHSIGIRSQKEELYSDFLEIDQMHCANDLLSCSFSVVFNLAVYRADCRNAPPHNYLNVMDSIVASNVQMQLAVGPGTWSPQFKPSSTLDTTVQEQRVNKMQKMEYHDQMAARYRQAFVEQPLYFRLANPILDGGKVKTGTWMWKRLSSSLRIQLTSYMENASRLTKPHSLKSDIAQIQAVVPSYDPADIKTIVDNDSPSRSLLQVPSTALQEFCKIHPKVIPANAIKPEKLSLHQVYEDVSLPTTVEIERIQHDLSLDYGTVLGLQEEDSREVNVANFVKRRVSVPNKAPYIDSSNLPCEPPSVEPVPPATTEPVISEEQFAIKLLSLGSTSTTKIVMEESEKSESEEEVEDVEWNIVTATARYGEYRKIVRQAPDKSFEGKPQPKNMTPMLRYEPYFEACSALFPGDQGLPVELSNRRLRYFGQKHKWLNCILPADYYIVIDHVYNFINGVVTAEMLHDVLRTAYTRYTQMAKFHGNHGAEGMAWLQLARICDIIVDFATRCADKQQHVRSLSNITLRQEIQALKNAGPIRVTSTKAESMETRVGAGILTTKPNLATPISPTEAQLPHSTSFPADTIVTTDDPTFLKVTTTVVGAASRTHPRTPSNSHSLKVDSTKRHCGSLSSHKDSPLWPKLIPCHVARSPVCHQPAIEHPRSSHGETLHGRSHQASSDGERKDRKRHLSAPIRENEKKRMRSTITPTRTTGSTMRRSSPIRITPLMKESVRTVFQAAEAVGYCKDRSLNLGNPKDLKLEVKLARDFLYGFLFKFFTEQARLYKRKMPDSDFERDFPQRNGLLENARERFDRHARAARSTARQRAGLTPLRNARQRRAEKQTEQQTEQERREEQRKQQRREEQKKQQKQRKTRNEEVFHQKSLNASSKPATPVDSRSTISTPKPPYRGRNGQDKAGENAAIE